MVFGATLPTNGEFCIVALRIMRRASCSSSTQTITETSRVLKLDLTKKPKKKVRWTPDTHDNERENRRKSKICCIFHKRRNPDDSSSSSDSSSCSDVEQDNNNNSLPEDNWALMDKENQQSFLSEAD
jgi:hypothetical protein